MNRRHFLKNFSATAAVTPFAVNGFSMRPFANSHILNVLNSCEEVADRVLILIQLKGGNDGLNTLVPLDQYPDYAKLRETIKIPDSGPAKYLNLDTTLPLKDQIGLHPVLSSLKELYDKGWANIVQGVGYENIDQSHFKGADIWLSGGDNSLEKYNIHTGWPGRALNAMYPKVKGAPIPEMLYPLGIQIGDPNPSLGFHTDTEHRNSINLSGQDPEGFYSLIQTIGGAPLATIPNSEYGTELAYIMGVEKAVDLYSQYISEAFKAGTNAISTYPQSSFAFQLKTIARLIKGGCKTKVYLCSMGGFDTHGRQIAAEGQITLGDHANRLQQLMDSVKTFLNDLNAMGLGEKVMACTFSEFGRCAKENGSLGTDHGTLAPMFIFGKSAAAGVRGTNVNLKNLTSDNQLQGQQFDYRQVFTSILQDWLGASNYVLEQTMFDGFAKIPVVGAPHVVSPDCYVGSVSTWGAGEPEKRLLSVSPNPAVTRTEVTYYSEYNFTARLTLHSLGGTLLQAHTVQVQPGINRYYLELRSVPACTCFVRLESEAGKGDVVKLIVTRE